MASIQPIEGGSVHRIQSGQVIVDLCSVVKELVENSLDAGASSIDVRFKSHGLDSIEVQDNGSGVSKDDYESIALKHYTSKLRSYEDLENLNTFGFRGEALSSLCALSDVHVLTATEEEAPKGSKLIFEISGKLKSTQTVAAQRGTTVIAETIFKNLPVRRQELTKNIKREYGKVLALLQAYACISTNVKISVSNTVGKKKNVAFATKTNKTTRENITNVFGAKTVSALVPLDLSFEMDTTDRNSHGDKKVQVLGHVSKPVVGEGRQTPDRQMFFVNQRPCALPQVAKVVNEVYKSYNLSQSPFIFANVVLDTNGYDVNVSPDKRTILLHDQGTLLDSLKESLTELFENTQQSVPQSHHGGPKHGASKQLPFKPLTIEKRSSTGPERTESEGRSPVSVTLRQSESRAEDEGSDEDIQQRASTPRGLISQLYQNKLQDRSDSDGQLRRRSSTDEPSVGKQKLVKKLGFLRRKEKADEEEDTGDTETSDLVPERERSDSAAEDDIELEDETANAARPGSRRVPDGKRQQVRDFNQLIGAQIATQPEERSPSTSPLPSPEPEIPSISSTPRRPDPGVVPNAFERMRPMRTPRQTATITIGDKTTTSTIGNSAFRMSRSNNAPKQKFIPAGHSPSKFTSSLRSFAMPGTQFTEDGDDMEEDGEEIHGRAVGSSWRGGGSMSEQQREDEPPSTRRSMPGPSRPDSSAHNSDAEEKDTGFQWPRRSGTWQNTSSTLQSGSGRPSRRRDPPRIQETQGDFEEVDYSGRFGDHSEALVEGDLDTQSPTRQTQQVPDNEGSDGEWLDEAAKKAKEDEKVARLIEDAERKAALPTEASTKRTSNLLKGAGKAATTRLTQHIDTSTEQILASMKAFHTALGPSTANSSQAEEPPNSEFSETEETAETRLSLSVSKTDFARMRIVGQFNLGFIIAVRPGSTPNSQSSSTHKPTPDELFIIDQHASDEKFNFERLQSTTVVQHQPLAIPQPLDLTAIEEELIQDNTPALTRNGFVVTLDTSGSHPIGRRAHLTSLPMSREVTFSARDLEELLVLLGDGDKAARPAKVRSMFAMRACRSSIMVGKSLGGKQMTRLVRNLGGLDKPWNCPHGRPTMRHLFGLGTWSGWSEGDGVVGMEEEGGDVDWGEWLGRSENGEDGNKEHGQDGVDDEGIRSRNEGNEVDSDVERHNEEMGGMYDEDDEDAGNSDEDLDVGSDDAMEE